MEVKKLDFGETLKDSVAIGVKNAPSVIAAVALWLITIWTVSYTHLTLPTN